MKTLLVVDDDQQLVQLLQNTLSPQGYHMSAHDRIRGAYEKAQLLQPDVMIIDVMFPDGSGYQLSRQIREDPHLYKTPILFSSTFGQSPEIEHALNQGGDEYLTKPYTLAQLMEKLKSMEELGEKVRQPGGWKSLVSKEALGRKSDHLLLRNIPFAFCHVSIERLEPFALKHGREKGQGVIDWLGQLLLDTARDLNLQHVRVAYINGGHFLVLLDPESYKKYFKNITSLFDAGIRERYKDFELEQGYTIAVRRLGSYEGVRLMELRILIAHSQKHHYRNSHEILHQFQRMIDAHQDEEDKPIFRLRQGEKW